ncbi:Fic family protein [Pseudotabrizicola formosa]|uniref:Fic family protein n=1 Tax=Pseudotabrizicola formosa TaxID=2030009 RepID=UPI000CD07CF8|nr:Fic family protein [Pseudotabrizicola formosa]
MKIPLDGSPYALSQAAENQIVSNIDEIEQRVFLLRQAGHMTEETLRRYYGSKRFEQVAESNAIEGSTLSIGETEVAVLKGITLTGHDPAYVRDALALDAALSRTAEFARIKEPTDIPQLLEIHSLILGDRPGGGQFRNERVKISGSDHVPPKTWKEVMSQMEQWEAWSRDNRDAPAPIRAAVLHAWLAHIHPFIDGNGRTARAISNLELIRAGYPPLIIRKKERDRYIDALSQSDSAGDIASFMDLIMERTSGAFLGLERAAVEQQAFNPVMAKLRRTQALKLEVWRRSVDLLSSRVELKLAEKLPDPSIQIYLRDFGGVADLDDFLTLCASKSIGSSWAFRVSIKVGGVGRCSFLAFIGHRSFQMRELLKGEGGPSLYWSIYDQNYERKWRQAFEDAPYFKEATIALDQGDIWNSIKSDDGVTKDSTIDLADKVASSIVESVGQMLS